MTWSNFGAIALCIFASLSTAQAQSPAPVKNVCGTEKSGDVATVKPLTLGVVKPSGDGTAYGQLDLDPGELTEEGEYQIEMLGVGLVANSAPMRPGLRLEMTVCDPAGRQVYPPIVTNSLATAFEIGRQGPPGLSAAMRRGIDFRPDAKGTYAFRIANAGRYESIEVLARKRKRDEISKPPKLDVEKLDSAFGLQLEGEMEITVSDISPKIYTFDFPGPVPRLIEISLSNKGNEDLDPNLALASRASGGNWSKIAENDDANGFDSFLSEELEPGLEYAIAASSLGEAGSLSFKVELKDIPLFDPPVIQLGRTVQAQLNDKEDIAAIGQDREAERIYAFPPGAAGKYILLVKSDNAARVELGIANPLNTVSRKDRFVALRDLGEGSGERRLEFNMPKRTDIDGMRILVRVSRIPESSWDTSEGISQFVAMTLQRALGM